MITTRINITFRDGTKKDTRFATWSKSTATDMANDYICKYVNNEKNPLVEVFEVTVGDEEPYRYEPTYPEH